jgi:hypothetical protein
VESIGRLPVSPKLALTLLPVVMPHNRQYVVCLPYPVTVLDLIEQGGDIAPAD